MTRPQGPSTSWFANDCTGREIAPDEAAFLEGLVALLERVRPAQAQAHDSVLTDEGPGRLIAIVPHQDLGGLSLVATLTPEHVQVAWAAIGSLEYHDDLDAATVVAQVPRSAPGWIDQAMRVLEGELTRTIGVNATFRNDLEHPSRMDFDLGLHAANPLYVVRPVRWTRWFRSPKMRRTATTSLVANERLPFRMHPLVYEWTPWHEPPAISREAPGSPQPEAHGGGTPSHATRKGVLRPPSAT